jgi:hypothetical protein
MATDLGQFLGGGGGTKKVHLTGSGTWTRPASTSLVRIIAVGGGSGPGGFNAPVSSALIMTGGGAGGWVNEYYGPVSQDVSYACGAGGTSASMAVFGVGGDTTVVTADNKVNMRAAGGGYATFAGTGTNSSTPNGAASSVHNNNVAGGGAGAGASAPSVFNVPSAQNAFVNRSNSTTLDRVAASNNPGQNFPEGSGGVPYAMSRATTDFTSRIAIWPYAVANLGIGNFVGHFGSYHSGHTFPSPDSGYANGGSGIRFGGKGKYGLGGGGVGGHGGPDSQSIPGSHYAGVDGGGAGANGPWQTHGNNLGLSGSPGTGGGAGGSVHFYPAGGTSAQLTSAAPVAGGSGGVIIEYWES